MEKSEILRQLNMYLDSRESVADKKERKRIAALRGICPVYIMVGEEPQYFGAKMECNSTGVGESSFGGTKTRRTVSLDYVTAEYLFTNGEMYVAQRGLEIFCLSQGEQVRFYHKTEMEKLAKREGFLHHKQYFSDLNFMITDHRLNRFTPVVTRDAFSCPIRPVTAILSEKGEKVFLGYIYELNGAEHVVIEPRDIVVSSGLLEGGFKPWMLIFVFCPILLLFVLFGYFVKYQKERMVG